MPDRQLLGMLAPSPDTTLEPVTTAMLVGLPEVSAHFPRFKVTEIALSGQALTQFDLTGILAAAALLSHARCEVIGWSGTRSAGWGSMLPASFARKSSAERVHVPALDEIFERTGLRRFGLVTPYRADVHAAIAANHAQAGYACVAERHLDLQDNFSFSEVRPQQLRTMVQEALIGLAAQCPEAIAILCTNLQGAPPVDALEEEFGVPVYDSIATVVLKSLQLAGVDTQRVARWGRLFQTLA